MSKELTEEWAIITPENCQEINTMISEYKKKIERLQKQLEEANKIIKDYDTLREAYAYNPGDIYLKKWSLK